MVLCMTYTSDEARTYVASVRWQFASTMPRIPHWYTIRKWRPELDGAFVAFVRHIRSAGIRMDWPDPPAKPLYRNQYLLLDGWKYWTMGDSQPGLAPPTETPETTMLINRARIETCPGRGSNPVTLSTHDRDHLPAVGAELLETRLLLPLRISLRSHTSKRTRSSIGSQPGECARDEQARLQ